MLISPPSLHHRQQQQQQQQSDADWLASILPDPSVGRYPLSTRFEWHGGIHVLQHGSGEALYRTRHCQWQCHPFS